MYNTPENRVYPTPETKQTQEKLKKSLLERLSKIANDSPPKSSSRKSDAVSYTHLTLPTKA